MSNYADLKVYTILALASHRGEISLQSSIHKWISLFPQHDSNNPPILRSQHSSIENWLE